MPDGTDDSPNGCRHVRTFDVREGDDVVTRCAATGCNAEVARRVADEDD